MIGLVKRSRVLWYISKWFLFLSPCQNSKGFFSDIYCRNVVKLLEANLTILWHPSHDWDSLESLTLKVVCHDPPAIHQLQFSLVYSDTGFWWFPLVNPCSGKLVSCDDLYLSVFLSTLGAVVCPVSSYLM